MYRWILMNVIAPAIFGMTIAAILVGAGWGLAYLFG